jgi:hypothetical protein
VLLFCCCFYITGETDLESIWYEHCQNKPVLSQYADAMHHLATDHWAKNQGKLLNHQEVKGPQWAKYHGKLLNL